MAFIIRIYKGQFRVQSIETYNLYIRIWFDMVRHFWEIVKRCKKLSRLVEYFSLVDDCIKKNVIKTIKMFFLLRILDNPPIL